MKFILSWPQQISLASELPPQRHEIEFVLTHKANFSYIPFTKIKRLSPLELLEPAR
jgi:hypothetical protein